MTMQPNQILVGHDDFKIAGHETQI